MYDGWLSKQMSDCCKLSVLQHLRNIQAIQQDLDAAVKERQAMQNNLEKERASFRASMTSTVDSRQDAIWKKKVMTLRAELDQIKQERDSYKRQCIR